MNGNSFTNSRRSFYLLIAAAVIIILWIVIGALITRSRTGTLLVRSSDSAAVVSLQRPGIDSYEVGKGSNVTVRLAPGTYTVSASAGNKQSAKTTQIIKGQNVSIDLNLEQPVPVSQVAPYRASSLYVDNRQLYFVDITTQTPQVFASGDAAAKPFNTNLYPTSRVYWFNPNEVYTLNNRVWFSVKPNTDNATLVAEEDYPSDSESVSINANRQYAYVSKTKEVVLFNNGYKTITTTKSSTSKTSIAADGSVLVYSGGSDGGAAQLYRNGTLKRLKADLSRSQYAVWSPDSQRFSYTTIDGIYVYDTKTDRSSQVMSVAPSSVFSPVWFGNGNVLYVQDQVMWRYSVTSNTSYMLAKIDGNMASFSPFAIGADGQNVYFSTSLDDNNKGDAIYRLVPNWHRLSAGQRQTVEQAAIRPPNQALADITYEGFDLLTKRGVTTDQLAKVKYVIGKYLASERLNVSKVTIPKNGFKSSDFNTSTATTTAVFSLKFDDDNYQGRLQYSGLSNMQLTLYDDQGNQVYDLIQ